MSDTVKTVDVILTHVAIRGAGRNQKDDYIDEAKQQLYQLMLDVIGENESSNFMEEITWQNNLRREQRTKLNNLFGVK